MLLHRSEVGHQTEIEMRAERVMGEDSNGERKDISMWFCSWCQDTAHYYY